MIAVYATLVIGGAILAIWARLSLPTGTVDYPVRVGKVIRSGPYRWLNHPMYIGNVVLITGLGGMGGGLWNALALMTLAELVHREWAWRERPGERIWP